MKRTFFVFLVGSLFAAAAAFATTYMRVEKDGTKTYSDRPMPGGQVIEITPAQTYSAPPPPSSAGQAGVPLEQQLLGQLDTFKYESCELTPKTDETFTNPERVMIAVTVMPSLRVGDIVDLRVDGTPVGGPTTISHMMQPAYRGSHNVAVQVKDRFGRALCTSNTTFHVIKPSLNSPNRPSSGPGAPPPKPTPPPLRPKPTPSPKGGG